MRRIATIALLAVLAGCVATKPVMSSGTYVTNLGQIGKKWMATLSLDHFEKIYPPALTRLDFIQSVDDSGFGAFLVNEMRQRGYAVSTHVEREDASLGEGLAFSYVLDEVVEKKDAEVQAPRYLYLRFNVGQEILSRMFIENNGEIHPAGLWSFAIDDEVQREVTALPVYREPVLDEGKAEGVMYLVNRIVTPKEGIILRNLDGKRLHPLAHNEVIVNSRIIEDVPLFIAQHNFLRTFQWGQGEWNNKSVLFPWELTQPELAADEGALIKADLISDNSAQREESI